MRLAAYATASTLLAAGVVLHAFHERPNFYSTCVYLAQSNACRMILLNLFLLSTTGFLFGLQRLLYGRLRPIEIEQLWEKAWYAITETALAMTIFRDEVGVWFFVMFMSLLAGKVWAWIGEGRVDILEQQPPTNPVWFHARLLSSLGLSVAFDSLMFRYCVRTLLEQPRPGMMVMFAFEFVVLLISSSSTAARYGLSVHEILVIKRQTKAKLEERREEVRIARQEAATRAHNSDFHNNSVAAPAQEEDIDENEIDVPGWQEKGRWVLFLDLATDFFKLVVYIGFFSILLVFHSIPIHIIRDVFITARSFLKRIHDFLKYRNATKDMNSRYPDATAEDLGRDSTCIVCREEMRPWQPPNAPAPNAAGIARPAQYPIDERQRPKKLPCGHILHFGCLRSWLERQQICPTCRRSVLTESLSGGPRSGTGQEGLDPNRQGAVRVNQPPEARVRGAGGGPRNRAPNNGLGRTFRLGRYRVTLAAGNAQQVQNVLDQARLQGSGAGEGRSGLTGDRDRSRTNPSSNVQERLAIIDRQIMQEINGLNVAQEQLWNVRQLQGELARLQIIQTNASRGAEVSQPTLFTQPNPSPPPTRFVNVPPFGMPFQQTQNIYGPFHQQAYWRRDQETPLDHHSAHLPPGMTLPVGWTLLPLERVGATVPESSDTGIPPPTGPIEVLPQIEFTEQPGMSNTSIAAAHPEALMSDHEMQPASTRARQDSASDGTATAPRTLEPDIVGANKLDGSRVSTSLDSQHSSGLPASQPSDIIDLPNWSSNTDGQTTIRDRNDNTAGASESRNREKGKGKAVTVEDDDDSEQAEQNPA